MFITYQTLFAEAYLIGAIFINTVDTRPQIISDKKAGPVIFIYFCSTKVHTSKPVSSIVMVISSSLSLR